MDSKEQAAVGREQAGPDNIPEQPIAKQAGADQGGGAVSGAAPATGDQPAADKSEGKIDVKSLTHDELVEQVIDTIVTEGMIDREKVTPDATIESLDLKSIDIVMILTALEDKFDVYIPMDGPFHDAKNVKDLIEAIATYIMKEKQA